MRGVTFGTKHSFRTWGLMLISKPVISPPTPKTKLVQVPGSDKVIDLTESLTGRVHYEMRQIKLEFMQMEERGRWDSVYSDILDTLHGKKMQIVFDDDPNFYYIGRVAVGDMSGEKAAATITITADVEPYKRDRHGDGRRL